jgi:(1->4)-alpha-D-glucan 1-alpha-D-glucosylmutase
MNVPEHRPIPRATYRLQLSKDFTFRQAAELAPYLEQLGISHAYLSPILKARRGSTHGYDTVDHSMINPELGNETEFETMCAALKRHGIGIVLDIVPNHMGIGGDENSKWLDVLEWGPESRFSDWFDINWAPAEPSLRNKILVPFLRHSFGEALESGELELQFDQTARTYAVWAGGCHKLPVCPRTYSLIGDPSRLERFNSCSGRGELASLIAAQFWRPARYSVAADDINYRRFFIVSDLAAIRIERDEIFDEVHRLTFEFVKRGLVDGLRVDHVDGLYDPKAYCLKVREHSPRPIYLVVEKILAPHEALRTNWKVDGTTGYEFSSVVTRLLTDPDGEQKLTRAYAETTGHTQSLSEIERDAKRAIMDFEMAAELDSLTARLRLVAASNARTVDLTRNAIRSGLREMIACLPVYRTYLDDGELEDEDRRNIALAVAGARESAPAVDPAVFDFLNDVTTGDLCRSQHRYDADQALSAARRIQQYTGPVMAKGLEDTALYRYNRLIALSDVGEKPDRFTTSVEAFHDFNLRRLRETPRGMLTTSSHDTKRGEDVRARVAALSGYADAWTDGVSRWSELLDEAGAPQIDANDRYYLLQLLLGAWPTHLAMTGGDAAAREDFRKRVDAAMLKSVREARLRTNWSVPRSDYEQKVSDFVATAFGSEVFLASFNVFEQLVATAGAKNGLIETVLKLTVPGIPDIYQGAEFWEQSMVDPDNRRPVDFVSRASAISGAPGLRDLIANWRDGRLKQHLIGVLLRCRRDHPLLFSHGSYEPLSAERRHCAFERRYGEVRLQVHVALHPWLPTSWDGQSVKPPGGMTYLLPGEANDSKVVDVPFAIFISAPAPA